MARTQAADYEQRREAIVDKAAQLFARYGFHGTSVSDLASACETSKSLIYHYYPSKEEILYAVMISHVDQLTSDVESVLALGRPPADTLDDLIHAFMEHYIGAAERQKVLLNELDNLPDDKRKTIVAKQRFIIGAVQQQLTKVEPALEKDWARARVKTMLVFGMINWTHTWFDPHGSIKPGDLADMVVELAGFKAG